MNFEEDIRQHVLAHLPHAPGEKVTLASKRAVDLLIIYVNWLRRLVPARPRRVHRSKALIANQFAPAHHAGLDQLVAKIETGVNITPHLSRGILEGFKPQDPAKPKALPRRRDLDLLLNDWGVHHLHLSTKLDKDGFVDRKRKRSDPPKLLLFAVFRSDDAYLIDLMQHGDWTRAHLLEVMVKEWPDAGLVSELKGLLPGTTPMSDDDRKVMRNVGMGAPLEMDGKVYAPIGYLTLAGTSIQTTMEVDRVLASLKWFQDRLSDNPAYIADLLRQHGLPVPSQLDLHFVFFDTGGYGVIETQTGLAMRLG
jgi:hypothetical protein